MTAAGSNDATPSHTSARDVMGMDDLGMDDHVDHAHDIPHPIGDPDEDEGGLVDDDEDDEADDEDDEEPLQV
jgi:hypothetical protein